jgi:hypothetical protein
VKGWGLDGLAPQKCEKSGEKVEKSP